MRKYYTLFGQIGKNEPWEQIFGDYSKADVEAEKEEYVDAWRNLKIICHGDSTAAMFIELNFLYGRI